LGDTLDPHYTNKNGPFQGHFQIAQMHAGNYRP
jgi:hypothetical protein